MGYSSNYHGIRVDMKFEIPSLVFPGEIVLFPNYGPCGTLHLDNFSEWSRWVRTYPYSVHHLPQGNFREQLAYLDELEHRVRIYQQAHKTVDFGERMPKSKNRA